MYVYKAHFINYFDALILPGFGKLKKRWFWKTKEKATPRAKIA